jgi:hypothetical protein
MFFGGSVLLSIVVFLPWSDPKRAHRDNGYLDALDGSYRDRFPGGPDVVAKERAGRVNIPPFYPERKTDRFTLAIAGRNEETRNQN